ncbi:MAG TPA: prepilin peptidase [Spirochaetota bacterium]|nr:prepilin peptidase [Spirochaetota bacterium]
MAGLNGPILCAVFFSGAVFGSFFYTLALRISDGEFSRDAVKAMVLPSHCIQCGERISIPYLIPIAGYFFSRGKCSRCNERISPLYPVMEILYGSIAVITALKLGMSVHSFIMYMLIAVSVSVAVVDIKTFTISGGLLIILGVMALYPLWMNGRPLDNLYGLLLMSVFFLVIMFLLPGSFGGGDVKFAAVLGAIAGLEQSVVILETALVSGAVFGIIYAAAKGEGFRIKIPFAPFLTLGLIISILYGNEIILLYYRILM